MASLSLSAKVAHAEAIVASASSKFEATARRRADLHNEDAFINRMLDHAIKRQREAAFATSGQRIFNTNLRKIEGIVASQADTVEGTQCTFLPNESFEVDRDQHQSAIPPMSGIWSSRDILDQKEYFVATDDADEDESTVKYSTLAKHRQPETVEATRRTNLDVVQPTETAVLRPVVHRRGVADDIAGVLNRLKSNDSLFFFPECDEYHSTQEEVVYNVGFKPLSLANGKLLTRFFDSKEEPIRYSTKAWSIRRSVFEALLCGQLSIDALASCEQQLLEVSEQLQRERTLRQRLNKELSTERLKCRNLELQIRERLNKKRQREVDTVVAALRIEAAALKMEPKESSSLQSLFQPGLAVHENATVLADIVKVLDHMRTLREDDDNDFHPFLSVESIRAKLLNAVPNDGHLQKLERWSRKDWIRGQRRALQSRLEIMEHNLMEMEDSHSAVSKFFVVGENVFAKFGCLARILTDDQRVEVFGKDLPVVQFFELTRARNTICPLCRFEFDATKPLSHYSDQIQEKTKKVTEEIHVLVGRKNVQTSQSVDDDNLNGTIRSQKSDASQKRRMSKETSRANSRPSSSVARDSLQQFEAQVAMMALHQMNCDLEMKMKEIQERLDSTTAAIRLEKMHFAALDAKYKETLRETGIYRRKFDEEMERSNALIATLREETASLQDEIRAKLIRIEDLEDVNGELKVKLERSEYAEKQINSLRFGFPILPGQKADLTFQEIGYVFYRKYFEVREQLTNLKRQVGLDPTESPTCDVGVGAGSVLKKQVTSQTQCVRSDLVPAIHREQQTFWWTFEEEAQTDPVRFMGEVASDDLSTQSAFFKRDLEAAVACERERNEVITKQFVDTMAGRHQMALDDLKRELDKVSKEKRNVVKAYHEIAARVSDRVSRMTTFSPPIDLDDDNCHIEAVEARSETHHRSSEIEGFLEFEEQGRMKVTQAASSILIPLHMLSSIVYFFQAERRSCRCRKIYCPVVELTIPSQDDNRDVRRLLPPLRSGKREILNALPSGCEPNVASNMQSSGTEAKNYERRAVPLKCFTFSNAQCSTDTVDVDEMRCLPVPPLPALALPPSITEPNACRAFAKNERDLVGFDGAVFIKGINPRMAKPEENDADRVTPVRLEIPLKEATTPRRNERDVAPTAVNHGVSESASRKQTTLLAARLQAMQRLGTPSSGNSLEPDLRFAEPVAVPEVAPELHMSSFLPRPLPNFKGGLPPQVMGLVKPPGGFGDGWSDAARVSHRTRQTVAQTVSRVSRAVSGDETRSIL